MSEESRWIQQRLPKFPKQANSADLVRHRGYDKCLRCEQSKAVATTWWLCQKCEEGTK